MDLVKTVKKFVDEPLLLGYSGGPDSKALLYALLEAGARPHLAHVDHGWRKESAEEAILLEKEAKELNLPFYSTRLTEQPDHNVEDFARLARLQFFRSLFEVIPFRALLLAHQADDLAETALKRIFEGAHLPFLGGMAPRTEIEGMPVWRPLLSVRKKEILEFLEQRSLLAFYDKTNDDPRFLRTRLRQKILPDLAATFGKEIVSNLALLSERSYELKDYLDRNTQKIPKVEGPWGIAFKLKGVERVEARHVLKKYIRSRKVLESVLDGKNTDRVWVKNGWTILFSDNASHSLPVECKKD